MLKCLAQRLFGGGVCNSDCGGWVPQAAIRKDGCAKARGVGNIDTKNHHAVMQPMDPSNLGVS